MTAQKILIAFLSSCITVSALVLVWYFWFALDNSSSKNIGEIIESEFVIINIEEKGFFNNSKIYQIKSLENGKIEKLKCGSMLIKKTVCRKVN